MHLFCCFVLFDCCLKSRAKEREASHAIRQAEEYQKSKQRAIQRLKAEQEAKQLREQAAKNKV